MNTKRIDSWTWFLIYGGMFLLAIGLATRAANATLGWSLGGTGALAITAGIVLIWLRSRMKVEQH